MEIQLYFIRDPWIQEMKQSILCRHCRQRQNMCFVVLICFTCVPAMDCSSSYKDCLMVLFSHIFYLQENGSTTKSFCCVFVFFFFFWKNSYFIGRWETIHVTGTQHVTVSNATDKVVIYELARIKSKRMTYGYLSADSESHRLTGRKQNLRIAHKIWTDCSKLFSLLHSWRPSALFGKKQICSQKLSHLTEFSLACSGTSASE